MSKLAALSLNEINTRLIEYPGWEYHNHTIQKSYTFNEYLHGIKFVQRIATIAEEKNHHPELIIGWCKVTVLLSTHDANGITLLDFSLAKSIDQLL